MPTTPNPNWPNIFAEGQFGANAYLSSLGGTLPYTELSKRLYKAWTTRRGKQFELDAVQAGEFQGSFVNTDGFLDPLNTSSPLSPNVLPYRGLRFRAQYPPSINLLTADEATGGEGTPLAAGTSGAAYGVTSAYGTFTVTASGTAYQGTQVWQFTGTTPSAGSSLLICAAAGTGQVDGLSYTQSIHVRSVTSGANPQVQPYIQWLDASGNILSTSTGGAVTLTGGAAASWTALSLTATMPTSGTAIAAQFGVKLSAAAPAGTWSFQADGLQWEQNSSASAFTVPGKSYYLLSGLAERYPQDWDFTGTYGFVTPVGVDMMALLSQQILSSAFVNDVLALGPNFFYELNDPAGATSCTDTSGNRLAAPVDNSPFGSGSLTLGSSVTSTTTAGMFLGAPGPVATFANNPSTSAFQLAETYIGLHDVTGNPGPPINTSWTRCIAFRSATAPTGSQAYTIWKATTPSAVAEDPQFSANIVPGSGGTFSIGYTDSASNSISGVATNACDGNWHFATISITYGSGTAAGKVWYDGSLITNTSGATLLFPGGIKNDVIGCLVNNFYSYYYAGMVGDVAHAIEFPFFLSDAQAQNLYTSWRSAYSGESSGARYSRILGWAGFAGTQNVDTGATTSMGPATDIEGTDALTALQNVVYTENGQHFIAGNGAATFQARTRRYNQTTIAYTFGDANPLGSEIPYESVSTDFDTTHLSNSVQITQQSTGLVFSASDATSKLSYGSRTLTRNNQSTSANECQDQATYLVNTYKDPHERVATMRLHPSANPSVLFPVCLSLELGMRVRVMRRPPAPAPAIQIDGFIENVIHTPDDAGEWFTDVQISFADTTLYWQMAALHTTLSAQALSGQAQATINALPDAAVNKLSQSLPQGYQLVFEPGTAREETMTLTSTGIPSTSLGYTTATLTFTSNFAFTHAANSIVCEPLPSGFTDPTTWDAFSVLGASYMTFVSSASIGSSGITSTPLPDSAINDLTSNFNFNDALWASPGTSNFEAVTLSSVLKSYLNYDLTSMSINSTFTKAHSFGDYLSDPLPAGVTNPTALLITPSARLAY